jgi:hypothetical protein
MADKYMPGLQFQDWNSMSTGGGGGLGSLAALFLADQMGLVDLSNKSQQADIQSHGILGGLLKNKMMGPKPEGSVPAPTSKPVGPVSLMGNDQLQQAMSMDQAPVAPVAPTAPQTPMAGMPSMSNFASYSPDASQYGSYDPEHIESSLSNFAKLLLA